MFRRRRVPFVCLLLAEACGASNSAPSAPPPGLIAHGGQRISAFYHVADGAEQFQYLFDNQLGLQCTFAPQDTGSAWSCLPATSVDLIYLDSACTDAVTTYDGPEIWVSASDSPIACMPPSAPYQVGERVFAGGIDVALTSFPSVYSKNGGTCAKTTVASWGLETPSAYRLVRQDVSAFVSATLASYAAGGGLGVQRVTAADGTEATVGILGLNGAPCHLLQDGTCGALREDPNGCSYLNDVPAQTPKAESIETGTGALRLQRFVAPAAPGATAKVALDRGDYFTVVGDRVCNVYETPTGDRRCLPVPLREVLSDGRWADAACQDRLYESYPALGATDDVAQLRKAFFDKILLSLFSMQEYVGSTYVMPQNDCVPAETETTERMFKLGAQIPLSSLPTVELQAL